jgi:hypothetical protein
MSGLTGTWTECLYKSAAVGATVAATAETQLNTNATMGPQPIIPGGFFTARPQSVGQALAIRARGVMSTTTGPPTFGILIRGSTSPNVITGPVWLGTSSTAAATASQTGVYWELEGTITVSIIGAATFSTIRGFGKLETAALATPFMVVAGGAQASPWTVASVDLTINQYLSVSCINSSASNSITLEELEVYGIN